MFLFTLINAIKLGKTLQIPPGVQLVEKKVR